MRLPITTSPIDRVKDPDKADAVWQSGGKIDGGRPEFGTPSVVQLDNLVNAVSACERRHVVETGCGTPRKQKEHESHR